MSAAYYAIETGKLISAGASLDTTIANFSGDITALATTLEMYLTLRETVYWVDDSEMEGYDESATEAAEIIAYTLQHGPVTLSERVVG